MALVLAGFAGGLAFTHFSAPKAPVVAADGTAIPKQTQEDRVIIADAMQSCSAQESCLVVDRHCGFCCDYIAINRGAEKTFDQLFNQHCASYQGQSCDCFDLSSYPSCVNGKCQLVKWSDAP